MLIDGASISFYPTGHGDSSVQFSTDVLLFNNTDDTLRYTAPWAQDSIFYSTDNENLEIINNKFFTEPSVIADTVPPHHCREELRVYFRFKKIPDTTFKFKIGMKQLKWRNSYKTVAPDVKTLQQADILWSDVEIFKTNKKHCNYDKTPQEYKEQCEKILDTLNENDRRNYILSIDPNKIGRLKDTTDYYFDSVAYRKDTIGYVPKEKQFKFVLVPLKLTNESNKIIEYTSWSCSWREMYQTNNKDVSVMEQFCLGNYPVTITVFPHSSSVYNIPMRFNKNIPAGGYKFRIGMTMLRAGLFNLHGFVWALPIFKRDPKYLIWSNEVTIPVSK